MPVFRSATAQLTLWYTAIVTVLCLLFSFIVFGIARQELSRPMRPPYAGTSDMRYNRERLERWREEREAESTRRLMLNLAVFNVCVIGGGAIASYYLARRTLTPIENALAAQARFSSDAAHELRTPLSVMQSEIEVALRAQRTTATTLRGVLGSTLDEVHRLQLLTDRLLLLASDKALPLARTNLEDVAIDAVTRVVAQAQAKKITIDNHVTTRYVRANHDSLTDTLVILLDNAIKYCPSASHVTVRSEQKPRHTLLHVSDNGPGIAEADAAHIFDRFYRADQSRSTAHVGGHGLGLSIAKRIIEAHHGTIHVHSAPGTGTRFTVQLPRK